MIKLKKISVLKKRKKKPEKTWVNLLNLNKGLKFAIH